MRYLIIAIATICGLSLAGDASAADWTKTEDGTKTCSRVKNPGSCWLKEIAADSSVIAISECLPWTIHVYGTGASIMPQTCSDASCTLAENLLAAVLTGDSPNTFVTSTAPFELLRIDWTAGGAAPTVVIKCGPR